MRSIFLIFIISIPLFLVAQKKVSLSGTAGLTMEYYSIKSDSNILNRQPSWLYRFYANPQVQIGNWKIPFNFNLSNLQSRAFQSYNKFGFSPSNKWVTLHLGHRNLKISEFSLDGHTVFGAGFEMNPGLFRAAALYGEFRRPVPFTEGNGILALPSFQRKGYLGKIGFGKEHSYIDFILMKVVDDSTSMRPTEGSQTLLAQQNAVFAINGKLRIAKKFSIATEHAVSFFTRDESADSLLGEPESKIEELGRKIFEPKESSSFRLAHRGSLEYNEKSVKSSVNYRRIEPEYTSLGRYFMRTDIEQLYLRTSFPIKKQKMRFSLRTGLERNDVTDSRHKQSKRILGSLNWFWKFKPQWSSSLMYSNFSQFQLLKDPLRADTAVYKQVTNQGQATVNYQLQKEKINHRASLQIVMRDLQNAQGVYAIYSSNSFQIGLSYGLYFKEAKLDVYSSFQFLNSDGAAGEFRQIRISSGLGKPILNNKIRLSVNNFFSSSSSSSTWNNYLSGNIEYRPNPIHKLNARIGYLWNREDGPRVFYGDYEEFKALLGYTYNFAGLTKARK